jgi:hypothetical protein
MKAGQAEAASAYLLQNTLLPQSSLPGSENGLDAIDNLEPAENVGDMVL